MHLYIKALILSLSRSHHTDDELKPTFSINKTLNAHDIQSLHLFLRGWRKI